MLWLPVTAALAVATRRFFGFDPASLIRRLDLLRVELTRPYTQASRRLLRAPPGVLGKLPAFILVNRPKLAKDCLFRCLGTAKSSRALTIRG